MLVPVDLLAERMRLRLYPSCAVLVNLFERRGFIPEHRYVLSACFAGAHAAGLTESVHLFRFAAKPEPRPPNVVTAEGRTTRLPYPSAVSKPALTDMAAVNFAVGPSSYVVRNMMICEERYRGLCGVDVRWGEAVSARMRRKQKVEGGESGTW